MTRSATGLRSSRTGRWRAAVLVGVHLLLAAHIAHWWLTGKSLSPPGVPDDPDPPGTSGNGMPPPGS